MAGDRPPERFGIYLVSLDPTVGHELKKTRPCVVISPPEVNRTLRTVIIAPLTTTRRAWPTRVPVEFRAVAGDIALDHLRAVDRRRLERRLGTLDRATSTSVLRTLRAMFAE